MMMTDEEVKRSRGEYNGVVFYYFSPAILKKIEKLKKSDTRFKDNQVYNQAIDDVLELLK